MISPNDLKFQDELDAASKLLDVLPHNELISGDFVVVCSSLDSVVLANAIANELDLSYELFFSERLYAPNNPECEIAIVSETEEIVYNSELVNAFDISLDFIYGEAHRKYEEKILKNVYKYRKGKLLENLQGRNILLVDLGCQTGITALVCIKSLINLNVKSITYGTPLIAADILSYFNTLVDSLYCAKKISNFVDVDFYYNSRVAVESAMSILEDSPHYLPLQKIQKSKEI
ncbi:phosphoribosyltransferase family protein [Campylobacter devanensis]|uniref:phosphoribosyltransferase family protein n=1 Tax=Campylobacter devanensis TaxID=3161138 RepID=UPI000A343BB6|nr:MULTISPECIES: phosphoribosyltransferase family protein [unclassified Campylobacter]